MKMDIVYVMINKIKLMKKIIFAQIPDKFKELYKLENTTNAIYIHGRNCFINIDKIKGFEIYMSKGNCIIKNNKVTVTLWGNLSGTHITIY